MYAFNLDQIFNAQLSGQWKDRATPEGLARLTMSDEPSGIEYGDLVAKQDGGPAKGRPVDRDKFHVSRALILVAAP